MSHTVSPRHFSTMRLGVGDGADHRKIELHFAEDRLGLALAAGLSTISMRSWLSDSIISYGVLPSSRTAPGP
jgi:hypothetical protein